MRRYERASTLMTSNRPVEDWGKLLGDSAAVSAMLDRLLHDFLEVRFSDVPGYMRETIHDALMERVDEHGKVVGFNILGVSRFPKERPFEAELAAGK